ncbi:Ty3/gypsy retrotransposon protein [Senna tora]|uniref:Ty3/gypsy retrotransposon protein n=1 Tax=Senna tora TaxID=362788 RepID=A0A834XIU7_9FABA|nr:Ty3/gypsy retrotransposon protein [Senna tora]
MAAKVPLDQRVILASALMTSPAYTWYKRMCPNQQLPSWDEFLEALLFKFVATIYNDPRVVLKMEEQVNTTLESMVIVAGDDKQEAELIIADEDDGLEEDKTVMVFDSQACSNFSQTLQFTEEKGN